MAPTLETFSTRTRSLVSQDARAVTFEHLTAETREKLRADIIALALRDSTFRRDLLANTSVAVRTSIVATDRPLAPDVSIVVREDSRTKIHLVIPIPNRESVRKSSSPIESLLQRIANLPKLKREFLNAPHRVLLRELGFITSAKARELRSLAIEVLEESPTKVIVVLPPTMLPPTREPAPNLKPLRDLTIFNSCFTCECFTNAKCFTGQCFTAAKCFTWSSRCK